MLARDQFEGSRLPSEGDNTLMVRSLPEGAQVTRAVITLTPVAAPGRLLFEERIGFASGQLDWGATKLTTVDFVEIDFHARRTLASVTGSGLLNSTLQVDLGGLYVQITNVGAIQTPTDPSKFTLLASTGGRLPSLATNKFKLSLSPAGSPDIAEVVIQSTPSNIALRLGQQPAFFVRPGELAQTVATPDFSKMLQNFLPTAKVTDGFYEVPLSIHSDTIARLDVTFEVEYVQDENALPDGLPQATLAFDHSSAAQAGSATLQVSLPAGAQVIPGRTTARVRGSFQNSRIVYGPTGGLEPAAVLGVNPSRAQAAPLLIPAGLATSALDLLLTAKSRIAQLSLDLVQDADGKPGSQSVLPQAVQLSIDSEIAGSPSWINVPLPLETQLKPNLRYWLVLQSLQGEALWSASPQGAIASAAATGVWTAGAGVGADVVNGVPVGVQYTDNGGLSWRQETAPEAPGPLEAFVHLRQPPAVYKVPIALQIGQGQAAQRVSLDRFQPLGRVDFALDFNEVADAINQVVAASGPATAPAGEHLRNGDMEKWQRVGDRLNRRQPQVVDHVPAAVAISSDGARVYVLGGQDPAGEGVASNCYLEAYDTTCGEQVVSVDLGPGNPLALALSPDASRAAVAIEMDEGNSLVWVDLEAMQVVGTPAQFTDSPPIPRFTPDGSQLYLLRYAPQPGSSGTPAPTMTGAISILSVPAVEAAFRSQTPLANARLSSVPIGDNLEPVDLAVSTDGARLFAGIVNHSSQVAELRAFDAASGQPVFQPVPLGANSDNTASSFSRVRLSLDLSPDGRRLAVANRGDSTLSLVDGRRGRLEGPPLTFTQGNAAIVLQAIVIAPDGRTAFVADLGGPLVNVVDLANRLVTDQISVSNQPRALAIMPSGEKLYVGDSFSVSGLGVSLSRAGSLAMSVIPIGALVPEEWTLTAGDIFPVCASQPFHRIAVLGDFPDPRGKGPARQFSPTAISEVVPVVGGVHYTLAFTGLATTSEALAEVFWYGGQCSLQQVDRLPLETTNDDPQTFKLRLRQAAILGKLSGLGGGPPPPARLEMKSPPGATLAEVRFSVPGNEAALLDNVSLQASSDSLSNGDLLGQSDGRLSGWELVPTGVVGVTVVAAAGLVTIRNGSNATSSLQQSAAFTPNKAFSLVFAGQGTAGPGASGDAHVRLEWLASGGASAGTGLEIPVVAGGSDRQERRGTSPAGTQQARLSLELPPGASLSVQRIALNSVDVTTVPLSFVAQAPGELTISDVHVVYQVAPPAPPKVAPQGLCPPTPPGTQPGSGSHGHCHCPNCGEDDDLCNAEPATTPGGAPALEGDCCHCGARVTLPGGPPRQRTAVPTLTRADAVRTPLVIRRAVGAVPQEVRLTALRDALARLEQARAEGFVVHALALGVRTTPVVAAVPVPAAGLGPAAPSAPPQPATSPTEAPAGPVLTDVTGLTEEQANRLAAAGIDSIWKLSWAKTATIAAALEITPEAVGVIRKVARSLQARASKRQKGPALTDVTGLSEEQANRLAAAGIDSIWKLSWVKTTTIAEALGITPEAVAVIRKEARSLQARTPKS